MTKENNRRGIASLVLGIVSLMFCWIPFLGLASGIIGLVCASRQKKISPNGIATGGLVTSIIGIVFSAIYNLIWIITILVLGGTVALLS